MTLQILICESETMIQEMIGEYMSPLGFKIVASRTESQCLDLINQRVPDVILLDTHLAASNTAQTLEKIRGKGLNIPVLLLGSNYGITSQEDAIELGANGFVEKPFKLKEFLNTMLSVMPN